jgi:hypothetical protein
MKIEVITCYYREELIAPLFLQHYAPWVDKITLLTHKYPDNFLVESAQRALVNEAVQQSKADWLIVVDSDELIFPKPAGTDPRKVLESETEADFIFCEMPRVWRHSTDKDLDFLASPVPQRIHGEQGSAHPIESKPCLFRPSPFMQVEVGVHTIHYPGGRKGNNWGGAHWHSADPVLAQRILRDRKDRISEADLRGGLCVHYQHVTGENFAQACQAHSNDPVVIEMP